MSGRSAAPAPHAPERLETARLLLTRPQPSDLSDLAALAGDPRVGAWLGGTLDAARSAELAARWMAHWDALGFGLWVLRDRESGAFVGRGGLSMVVVAGAGAVEAGWAIVADRWGAGLATELGAAAISVAEHDLGLRDLVSFTMPDNVASRRVMEKLAFTHDADIDHRGLPHVLYRRRAPAPTA